MSTKRTFKQRFWKLSKWSGFVFLFMMVFRLIYGYVSVDTTDENEYYFQSTNQEESNTRNYASEKSAAMSAKSEKYDGSGSKDMAVTIDYSQKYEKTANLKSKTSKFDEDVKKIKDHTKNSGGVIQYEHNAGQTGDRFIYLVIGVKPEKFDSFYMAAQQIGINKSKEVTKVDKTNEYRQLMAKRASLEKTLTSLNELKSKGGAINDFVSLHDKILEIEGKLQELGVELGNFDTENEFCTVKFALYEGTTERTVSFVHRLKVALEWTIKYYLMLVFAFLGLSVSVFILLFIVDKIKLISAINNKLNE